MDDEKGIGFGFGTRTDFGKPSFSIFEVMFHYHPSDDPDPCQWRYGVGIALFGLHFDVGVFTS